MLFYILVKNRISSFFACFWAQALSLKIVALSAVIFVFVAQVCHFHQTRG